MFTNMKVLFVEKKMYCKYTFCENLEKFLLEIFLILRIFSQKMLIFKKKSYYENKNVSEFEPR